MENPTEDFNETTWASLKKDLKTKVGEISVRVQKFSLLSKALRPLPLAKTDAEGNIHDAFTNPELRYRQRYADLVVKSRIDISQEELIQKMIERPNGMEYLEVLSQVQMAMAQLDTIKTSSDKAVRVVQDMRSFIKGESVVEQKMINLRDNISTVLSVFNYEISLHVNLVFEVDPSIEIMGYDIKLFQLWSNIVKNGLEAMSDQKDRYLGIFAERKEDQLKVVFENNGPKIPDEIAGTIFKKYYTTKAKKSGSGLGLSIVQNVLNEHKANIILESNESLTKFIITFDL